MASRCPCGPAQESSGAALHTSCMASRCPCGPAPQTGEILLLADALEPWNMPTRGHHVVPVTVETSCRDPTLTPPTSPTGS
eukprot:scaffold128560_cov17-Tisochrysis_lutea.AAC.1